MVIMAGSTPAASATSSSPPVHTATPRPSLGRPAQHRPAAERLGRVEHGRLLAERLDEVAAPAAEVLLVQDEHRGAVLPGQVTHVDPAHSDGPVRAPRAARPDRRVQRVQVGRGRGRVLGGQHVRVPWPGRVSGPAHWVLLLVGLPRIRVGRARPRRAGPGPRAARWPWRQPARGGRRSRGRPPPCPATLPGTAPGSRSTHRPAVPGTCAKMSGRARRAAPATRSGSQDSSSSSHLLAGVREQPRAELRRLPQAQAEVSGLAQGGHGVRVCVPDSIGGVVEAALRRRGRGPPPAGCQAGSGPARS